MQCDGSRDLGGRKFGEELRGTHAGLELFFAGLHFKLRSSSPELAAHVLTEVARLPCSKGGAGARVEAQRASAASCELLLESVLEVAASRATDEASARSVRWTWRGLECRLETPSASACVCAGQAGAGAARAEWSGQAALALQPGSLEALLTGVAAALVYRQGGAVLHAAGVELRAGVVAFIGPSGAGKSTAARQCAAPLFAVDRIALAPRAAPASGRSSPPWLACALSGGTREAHDGARSAALVLPLRAVLRVRQSPRGSSVVDVGGARALGLLRAAVFQATRTPSDESQLLEALESLALSVPVAELHFGLGVALEPAIADWLSKKEAP